MKTNTKQTTKTGTEAKKDITWKVFSGEWEGNNAGERYREEEA